MTDLLSLFWPFVDAPERILPGRVVAAWQEGAHERLVNLGILQEAGSAECVMCPECFEHEEEVIALDERDGRTRWMIPCPEVLRAEVPPAWLAQWAIHLPTLIKQMAHSLELSGTPQELVPNRLWRLGRLKVEGSVRNLLFACQVGSNDDDLLAAFKVALRPIVLFAGDVPAPAWWQDQMHPCASVPDIAECHADGITIDREALLTLASPEGIAPEYEFRRRGEYWDVTFDKATVRLKDSVGLAYLARLLSEPHRDIPAVQLLAARAGIDPLISTGSSGAVLDDAARQAYSARYQDLCEELDSAVGDNDQGRVQSLQQEMDCLAAELASATGLGGRDRQKTDIDRVRKSVSMAVARDIERIAKEHASLGRHLSASILSGLVFRYSPERDVDWRI